MSKKAIGLLSGGLDSALAIKLVMDQGVEVEALHFEGFYHARQDPRKKHPALKIAEELGLKVTTIEPGLEYLGIIKAPKHGFGSALNPCIDCRIYMLKRAKKRMEETGASFIVSGEVVGQRPMSQRRDAIDVIDKEAGVEGIVVRPLCAKLLKPTIAEEEGIVDRERFLDIQGRSRRKQFELAKKYGIKGYSTPAGGCLLTDPVYAERMKDLLIHDKNVTIHELNLLKLGRHFRLDPKHKIVAGRNKEENDELRKMCRPEDIFFRPLNFGGPSAVSDGSISGKEKLTIAGIIVYYGKKITEPTKIETVHGEKKNIIKAARPLDKETVEGMKI